jgi:RNA polymerase sigma-70 factor (sigma-E family)
VGTPEGHRLSNDESFCAFAARAHSGLFYLALSLTGDRGLSEDLVQTALVRAYAKWGRLRGGEPLAYCRRIVVNAQRDRWRRNRGREVLVDEPPDVGGVADDAAQAVADRDEVARALLRLTPKERRVVVLRLLSDLSERETADELGMTTGAVRSALHRGVDKLRSDHQLAGQWLEA